MLDHATGIVIGETAVIGDNCSLLHGVTLGGTGNERGDRHPKIGSGVMMGSGAKILGNIKVGDCVAGRGGKRGSARRAAAAHGCRRSGSRYRPRRMRRACHCDGSARRGSAKLLTRAVLRHATGHAELCFCQGISRQSCEQMPRKLRALHANVGHGHDLPEGGTGERTDAVEN